MARSNIIDLRAKMMVVSLLDQIEELVPQGLEGSEQAAGWVTGAVREVGEVKLVAALIDALLEEDRAMAAAFALESIGGRRVTEELTGLLDESDLPESSRMTITSLLSRFGVRLPMDVLLGPNDIEDTWENQQGTPATRLAESFEQIPLEDRAFAINGIIDEQCAPMSTQDRTRILSGLISDLGTPDSASPDMLFAFSEFGADEHLRDLASAKLEQLTRQGIEPSRQTVKATFGWGFKDAVYTVDDDLPQRTLLILAHQNGLYQMHSFLLDDAFWDGGLKDYWWVPEADPGLLKEMRDRYTSEGLGRMKRLKRGAAARVVRDAVNHNLTARRPLPVDFHRYHRLVAAILGDDDYSLPSPSEEASGSALKGDAREVEVMLKSGMEGAGFDREQVWNARMLWRDFFEGRGPRIGKPETWASTIHYVIGDFDGAGMTQKQVAAQYGVSAGTISQRTSRLADFLHNDRPAISYSTRTPDQIPYRWQMTESSGVFGGLDLSSEFDDDAGEDGFLAMYQDYAGACAASGERPLAFDDFEQALTELAGLSVAEQMGRGLSAREKKRFAELKRLLLVDE